MFSRVITLFRSSDNFDQRLRLALFLFFIMTFGIEMGRIGRDSYFLTSAGAQYIPYMYLFMAFLMLIASGIYSVIIDKWKYDRFLKLIFCVGIGMNAFFWLVRLLGIDFYILPFLNFCCVEAFILFLMMHFWNYVNFVFEQAEGKKAFPLIGAVGLLATVCAGLTTKILMFFLPANTLFLMWLLMLSFGILVVNRLRERMKEKGHTGNTLILMRKEKPEEFTKQPIKAIWNINLIKTLSYMSFPLWIVIYIIEFYYYQTMNRVFPNQEELAGFLGLFSGFASLSGFICQILITPLFIRKFGVGATSTIYPISLGLGSLSLLIFSLFPAASQISNALPLMGIVMLVVFARFCDIAVYYSLYESTSQLVFYSISEKLRGRSRAFISGFVVPISTLMAGGILILLQYWDQPIYSVTFICVTVSFGLIVFSLKLTPDYLMAMVQTRDVSKKGNEELEKEISKLENADLRYVFLTSVCSQDEKEARFAIDKLLTSLDEDLIEELEEVATQFLPNIAAYILKQIPDELKIKYPDFIRELSAKQSLLS